MDKTPANITWTSPIPEKRWRGARRAFRGVEAFKSLDTFEKAQVNEIEESLADHERQTLGRLLKRGKKIEIDVFIRSHGPNPLFPPQDEIDVKVGVARADVVNLSEPASREANMAVLNGEVVHVLFQAGEASRFGQGPFYHLKPLAACESLSEVLDIAPFFERIDKFGKNLPPLVNQFIVDSELGPRQPVMIRAALRRTVQAEINAGRVSVKDAAEVYRAAIKNQKLLFFISSKGDIGEAHLSTLKDRFGFFGFDPENIITVVQQGVRGVSADEDGNIFPEPHIEASDSAGHLYALLQSARAGDFSAYTQSGRPIKSQEMDGLAYLAGRGGKFLNIIRINDMDRHTTEIVNTRALTYALGMFEKGYVNVIESVANPMGQKGGTGTTFGDPAIHVLTETHENSFPSLSRAFDAAMKTYLTQSQGQHPAYNAMRQWALLQPTRAALREYGGRIVFVPRQKEINGETISYLGVDMPMGDLSLLHQAYKSRMFQFAGPNNKELHIHDMKTVENLPIALRTIERELQDPHVIAAVEDVLAKTIKPFSPSLPDTTPYGAPAPEFE